MKIGEFAAKNQISPDTVRYYVREGLLYPVREGYHFSFDEQCSRDLRRVQTLKNIGFSLSEIKQIMLNSTERLFAAEASSSVCRQLYEKRLAEITGELRRLEQARAFLEERLELEEAKADFSRPVGIPLAALNWLVCPDCRESLVLESDQIRSGQIISGALTCPHCGRVLPVEDGILMVSPAPDAHKNFSSFDRFIDQTNQPLMQAISQSVRLMKSRVAKYQRPVRTFLDAGSGFGFFLRYTYDLIPDHSLYFAVDHDPMRHRFLKSVLASMPEQKNIALLCCDYGDIPLRSGSIDQIIDFGGSNDYSWIVPGFLMERLDWLTHEKSTALYLNRSYDRISFDSSIQPECRGYLYEEAILSNLKKLGYAIRERYRMDFTTPLQATNPFMNDRDQMYRLWLYLEKQR